MALTPNDGAALPLAAKDLRPFLAPLLLARAKPTTAAGFLDDLVTEVGKAVTPSESVDRSKPVTTAAQTLGAMSVKTLQYVEASTPPWAPSHALQDITHHLIVVAVQGDHAAICTSDAALRGKLARKLEGARPLPRALVERAFVGDRASVMWLNGIHSPIDAKPNAKTLSGSALEFALDPLGDQSFYYSAVRSRVSMPGGAEAQVGAAPGSGRIWLNRPKTWGEFTDGLATVFEAIAKAPAAKVKFKALAQSASDLKGVSGAYAVTVMTPELVAEQDLKEADREMVRRWAEGVEFDVQAGAKASFSAGVMLDGVDLGRLTMTVTLPPTSDEIALKPEWDVATPGDAALRREGERLLSDPKWLKIYYESGHAVSQGRCYASAYRDEQFEWDFRNLSSYEIKDEKPKPYGQLKLSDVIGELKEDGKNKDDSLFAYVVDTYGKSGWLACDDGSGEMADFIHIAKDDTVTLIHVKASKSKKDNRSVSVSNYEVVVGQAVKNLRHLQNKTLSEELKRGKANQIATAVWCDGNRIGDRTDMIERAKKLPAAYKRVVVVLQPQLTDLEHERCFGPKATRARAVRMKQLDTLMLSAQLSCMAVGAKFIGMAEKKKPDPVVV